MFTIILQNSSGETIEEVFQNNNDHYLMQDDNNYKVLNELSECSYDVFTYRDMERLIIELEQIKSKLKKIDDVLHVDKVISLAKKCTEIEGGRLIFTPFKSSGLEQ